MATPKLTSLIRSLSTNTTKLQMVKPPIQVFGIEGRYATALYSAATKKKSLDAVEKELVSFQKTMHTDKKLHEFIANPTIKRQTKSEAIKALATKIKLSDAGSNLLQLLAENGRLKKLNGIINSFKLLMAAHRGEVICVVTTAKPMDAAQTKQLESVLKSFVQANESVHLTSKVDPAIIGGMVVSIGDRYVDMSIANKIKKYSDIITISA